MKDALLIGRRLRLEFFNGQTDQIQDAQEMYITDAERVEDAALVFSGAPVDVLALIVEREGEGGVMKVLSADPANPADGEAWIRGDLVPSELRMRVGTRVLAVAIYESRRANRWRSANFSYNGDQKYRSYQFTPQRRLRLDGVVARFGVAGVLWRILLYDLAFDRLGAGQLRAPVEESYIPLRSPVWLAAGVTYEIGLSQATNGFNHYGYNQPVETANPDFVWGTQWTSYSVELGTSSRTQYSGPYGSPPLDLVYSVE